MKVVLIEDEITAAKYLIKLLNKIDQRIEVICTLDSVKSSVRYFKKYNDYDLIITDVQLGDGICFEIFEEISVSAPVIFTTAYDHYAIKAFKLNSLDYILKPIKQDDLEFAVDKYQKAQKNSKNVLDQVTSLMKATESKSKTYTRTLLIPNRDSLIPVKVDSFSFFYLESNIVRGITNSGNIHIIYKTISELEDEVDPNHFYRANRQLLVNRNGIDRVHNHYHGKLKISMTPNFEDDIIISKAKSKGFKNWLISE